MHHTQNSLDKNQTIEFLQKTGTPDFNKNTKPNQPYLHSANK